KEFGISLEEDITFYRAKGCNKCNNTGYKGRIGLYELMLVSENIEKLAIERANTDEIMKVAISEGMTTLQEDGLEKAKKGLTSLEEIARIVI
ncbi:MAG: type IV-A pilus assembly ATPase PilB, partial [Candidatus Oleimmundimicrobium sp.]|nr:type IV-A pilus assembly ATPase PilB [Candidatus Oleimmundimicrobium sp.]